jgi:putative acetyltransferase
MKLIRKTGMRKIHIRRAKTSEATAIVELVKDTIRKINARDHTEEQIAAWIDYQSVDRTRRDIESGQYIVYADDAGEIVGVGSRDADQIHALFTAADRVGKGVGSELLARMAEDAKSEGFNELRFLATTTALPFYQNRGYKKVDEANWPMADGVSIEVAKIEKKI